MRWFPHLKTSTRSLIVATGQKLENVIDEVVELNRDNDKYVEKMQVP